MNVKKAALMASAFAFFLGLTGIFSCSMGMGGSQCSGGCGSSASLSQSLINQCTAEHTVPCLSQVSCQYVCSNNPNMPGGQGQPCATGQ